MIFLLLNMEYIICKKGKFKLKRKKWYFVLPQLTCEVSIIYYNIFAR